MAYTSINKPSDYFNTKLWTGNGSTQSITGIGFQPDFAWIKSRTQGSTGYNGHHFVFDSIRGATNYLRTSLTNAEGTAANSLTSFDSDGYSLGSLDNVNAPSDAFVGWNWLGGGTASSNTDGSITSSVSANTTAGFSIVSYTGAGSATTVGHGLNSAPELIFFKNRDASQNWATYVKTLGGGKALFLDGTDAQYTSSTYFNGTDPSSTVFHIGSPTNDTNQSGADHIAYCFHSVKGYSKIGSYEGNNNADGSFVYTGFKPGFILVKNIDTAGTNWQITDTKRIGYNLQNHRIYPDDAAAESTTQTMDILSNGFKMRTTNNLVNAAATYIYMAFAENPFVTSTGIPATAR